MKEEQTYWVPVEELTKFSLAMAKAGDDRLLAFLCEAKNLEKVKKRFLPREKPKK